MAVSFDRLSGLPGACIHLAAYALGTALLFFLGRTIYNVFFHPLASYPGPLLWRASRLPFCVQSLRGTLWSDVLPMFEKYGPVVRIAPNELAYASADAWREILGHNPKGEEAGKYTPFYKVSEAMPSNVINENRERHAVLRRNLAHGFSDRSMRAQEPLIKGYIDMMINGLRERSAQGMKALDMAMWFNFATFDIIGDLSLGAPFDCLATGNRHPWIEAIFYLGEYGAWIQVTGYFLAIRKFLLLFVPKHLQATMSLANGYAKRRVEERMAMGALARKDLLHGLLLHQEELGLSLGNLIAHASLLVVAGSETTATLLSAATYLLGTHPAALARVTAEVRAAFTSEDDINIEATASRLPYMLACLNEAFRVRPPVAFGLPRVVPAGGKTYLGRYVPEGTIVSVWMYAANHYSENWIKPFEYHPERFLPEGEEVFGADNKEALQPFSYGPRICLGKNLAYAEMRMILARLLFHFDVKLAPESKDWFVGQKFLNLWKKTALMVHLEPRR